MAFCTQCGAQVPDGTAFCSNCGAKMNPAPQQNQPVYQDQGFGGNNAFGGQGSFGQNDAFGGNNAFGNQGGFGGQNDAFGGQNFGGQNFGGQGGFPGQQNDPFGGQGGFPGGPSNFPGNYNVPPKKKKSNVGLIIGIVVLVLALVGGGLFFILGRSGANDPNVGRYNAISCRSMGIELDCEGEWIELKAGGKAEIHILNDDFTGKWKMVDDTRIVITQNGDNFSGTLQLGILYVDFSGVEYTFAKEGYSVVPNAPAATEAPVETVAPATEAPATEAPVQTANPYEYWEGDWYGWWIVYRSTGRYEESKGNFWDCCARINMTSATTGHIKMWDEDCPDGKTIFFADVSFGPGRSEVGAMTSTSGAFLDQDLTYGMLSADPADTNYINGIPNMICIHGTYVDPDNSADTIDYLVFLRPWGTRWEDVRNRDNSQEIYSDMMPGYYDSWYLPLINKGITSAPTYMGLD